jgi:hypothetical protein
MTIGIVIGIIIVYLLFCFILYKLGESKKIRGWRLGLISLLFTPVIGFIVYYFSPSRMIVLEKRYICTQCKYEFTHYEEYCPHCLKSGKRVKLKAADRNMV